MRQLRDSSYIILGDKWANTVPGNYGWAAKVSRSGNLVWSRSYSPDTTFTAEFRDMAEGPNGSLVFTGTGYTRALPAGQHEDLWLAGVDSNGCETGSCGPWVWPTAVAPAPQVGEVFRVYPNPTSGSFTVEAPAPSASSGQAGEVMIYSVEGQCVATYNVKGGTTTLQLPAALSAGMYMCKYIPGDGHSAPVIVRLVYAP